MRHTDDTRAVDENEGVPLFVYDDAAGVDIRGRYVIDPDVVIWAMEVLTPEVGRNPEELIRQVKAFQHVRATGEVTPSGWQPGQVTLEPGTGQQGLGGLETLVITQGIGANHWRTT